jgi:hypothetical protein
MQKSLIPLLTSCQLPQKEAFPSQQKMANSLSFFYIFSFFNRSNSFRKTFKIWTSYWRLRQEQILIILSLIYVISLKPFSESFKSLKYLCGLDKHHFWNPFWMYLIATNIFKWNAIIVNLDRATITPVL